jgi:hypothetical protein
MHLTVMSSSSLSTEPVLPALFIEAVQLCPADPIIYRQSQDSILENTNLGNLLIWVGFTEFSDYQSISPKQRRGFPQVLGIFDVEVLGQVIANDLLKIPSED